jgi:multicomponent Na+:H+ antiporter subunit D
VELSAVALLLLGTGSVIYGALQAISRHRADEVLAYSAIGQVGYVLLALSLGGPAGYAAAVLYSVLNSANKTLLFLAAGLRGPLVGAAFVIGAFSVAGVPPAGGFLGKAALFGAGLATGDRLTAITVVGLVFAGGALSFVYMFQVYQRRFWVPEEATEAPSRVARRLLVLGLAGLVVALGVWPEPLLALSQYAAAVLPERLP